MRSRLSPVSGLVVSPRWSRCEVFEAEEGAVLSMSSAALQGSTLQQLITLRRCFSVRHVEGFWRARSWSYCHPRRG
jgi:hypothetical protein